MPTRLQLPSHFEHLLGIGAVLLGLFAIIACVLAGWYLAWASSLRDIQFFQELLGQSSSRAMQRASSTELKAEIARIKAQHRRSSSAGLYPRAQRRASRDMNGSSGRSRTDADMLSSEHVRRRSHSHTYRRAMSESPEDQA